jgi:hypothetical protein
MGILIAFEDHRPRAGIRSARAGGPAAVLLFTGVRYERGALAGADAAVPDRIDLAARSDRPAGGPRGNGRSGRRRRA